MKSMIIETLHYNPVVLRSSPTSPEGSAIHRLSCFVGQGEVPTKETTEGSFWGDGARAPAEEQLDSPI